MWVLLKKSSPESPAASQHSPLSTHLLADFYGRVLIPPTAVAHNRPDLAAAVAQVRRTCAEHQLQDGRGASERTGR